MNVLHILNSYGGTEVYKELIQSLDELGVEQVVFIPLNPNNQERIGNYLIEFKVPASRIIYSTKLRQYHRYLYDRKIIDIQKEIVKQVDINHIDISYGYH
jgi:hypothetical protein